MSISVVSAPVLEPVSTDDAKAHLRVTENSENDYIAGLVSAARVFAEDYTGSVFVERTLQLTLDSFPCSRHVPIIIPVGPVQSITSIDYVDPNGETQAWSSSDYLLDADPKRCRVVPAFNQDWPGTREQINAVTMNFLVGYPGDGGSPVDYSANIPAAIIHAIKLLIGHWYENRMEAVMGAGVHQVPVAAMNLLWPYKIKAF